MKRTRRLLAVALLCLGAGLTACASSKAGMDAPELPARHWLEETPGVPVEKKGKLDAVVANLYDPAKRFTFEDCVYLTIQQSPLLVNSAVNLEIKRLALTNAIWKYMPEPRMTMTVSNNLTSYNKNEPDIPGDYGRTKMRVGFYAAFPNPIATYFEHQVQRLMVNLAISTHRKAVGEAIYKIASAYMRLHAQRLILAEQEKLLPLAKEMTTYWKQLESVDGRQGVSVNLATQHEREQEIRLEKAKMQEVIQLTELKILAGVDPQQKLNVDTKSAESILKGFDGRKLKWEERWDKSEDDLLLRSQIKLADYNIMISWAAYVPDMRIDINNYPPAGQAQPTGGTDDTFLHLTFDFPLIDWGRRYRGVQTARMQKAQAFNQQARKRTDYSNTWLQAEQRVSLAETNLRLARLNEETAKMQYTEAKVSFDQGLADLPAVSKQQEKLIQSQIKLIEAELEYRLANLEWMYVASLLQESFLGLPGGE